jgi:tRNA uracil 4-sulfurtransferase
MKEIFIKYGELSTKKNNKNYFIKVLKNNIEKNINNIEVTYDFGRMFINVLDNNYDLVIDKLKDIFGIHEIVICEKYNELDIESIKENTLNSIKNLEFKTFKVETKRSNKSYPIKSIEVSKLIGGYILKNIPNIKVDVNNPELLINIEIRNEEVLIYHESIPGIGGYPVGTLGKGLLMLSGGIDSPVSGYLAMKRGVKIDAIYFESPPHTSEMALNKVVELANIISKYGDNINVHVINFTEIQEEIYKNIPHEYLVTIMRRMMYRISERVAKNIKADIIVNGESIGQVASQTLKSMKVINEVVKTPVIRPVACLDKLEIIKIAKSIGTYDTSILPYEDCCTIFVPDHPVINPELDKCIEYERTFPYEELIEKAIKTRKIINPNEKRYQELL